VAIHLNSHGFVFLNVKCKLRNGGGSGGLPPENFEKLDATSCNLAYIFGIRMASDIIQNWAFAEQKTVVATIGVNLGRLSIVHWGTLATIHIIEVGVRQTVWLSCTSNCVRLSTNFESYVYAVFHNCQPTSRNQKTGHKEHVEISHYDELCNEFTPLLP